MTVGLLGLILSGSLTYRQVSAICAKRPAEVDAKSNRKRFKSRLICPQARLPLDCLGRREGPLERGSSSRR